MNGRKTVVETITGRNLALAQRDTELFLQTRVDLAKMLDDFRLVGAQALPQGAPFDFDNQNKITFHPFKEAATEIDLAVFFAQSGMYKSFYHHLRAFFELYLIAVYFLSPNRTIEEAHQWLDGDEDTPFFRTMLTAIFQENRFKRAQDQIQLKEYLQKVYRKLCNIVHNKGEICGHLGIAKANFPRFLPETFEILMEDFRACIEVISVTFALRCPLILAGFPMLEKFGVNPPLSGFLDEMESEAVKRYISPEKLTFLNEICKDDNYFISAKDWVFSRPDLTEEQISEQIILAQDHGSGSSIQ